MKTAAILQNILLPVFASLVVLVSVAGKTKDSSDKIEITEKNNSLHRCTLTIKK